MERPRRAVLLMAYGSPQGLEDVERYYTHILGGRRPSPEAVASLTRRYAAIGGSPLREVSERQRRALQERLAGEGWEVLLGFKHAPPYIAEMVELAWRRGVEELVAIALAPHYAPQSVGSYLKLVSDAVAACGGPSWRAVRAWHLHPGLIRFWVDQIAALRRTLPQTANSAHWLFSAHSLPATAQDYAQAVEATARRVAQGAGLARWEVVYQSRPQAPGEWLGPELEGRLLTWAQPGATVAVVPIGFISDHLETLYDLDVQARATAERSGVSFFRLPCPNDQPALIEVLADLARHPEAAS